MKTRADQLLVARGLVDSRARAQAEITAGTVRSGDRVILRPSERLAHDAPLTLTAPANPYVSRGGLKLAHALDRFGLAVAGRRTLDVGASTGGFTEVCLARGAAGVVAVDVGHGQIHPRVAGDPRVQVLEGTDIRVLPRLDPPADLIVVDVSFISLAQVLPAALAHAALHCDLVALIKPQFEAGRAAVGKGGVVRSEAAWQAAMDAVRGVIAGQPGWRVAATCESPILGGDGNREFFLHARRG